MGIAALPAVTASGWRNAYALFHQALPPHSTTNQAMSAAPAVLARTSRTFVADVSATVAVATPGTSSPTYAVRPMAWPPPYWAAPRPVLRVVSTASMVVSTVAVPPANDADPERTLDPSFSSTTCQVMSSMGSGVPDTLRSMVSVVVPVSRARRARAPMSSPVPLLARSTRANVWPRSTAPGSVTAVDVSVPVSEVVPRCTLTSAARSNDTTCHQMPCGAAVAPVS